MTEFEDRFAACKAIKDEIERNSCMLLEIIKAEQYEGMARVDKVYEQATSRGISKETTKEFLIKESQAGRMYFPRGGMIGRPPWDEEYGGSVSLVVGSVRPPRVMPMNRTWTLELQKAGEMERYEQALRVPLSASQQEKLDRLNFDIIKKEEETDPRGGAQFVVMRTELFDFPDFDLSPMDIRKSLQRLRAKGLIEVVGGSLWRTTRKA